MIKECEIEDGQIWESLELVMSISSRPFDPYPRADVYVKTNRGLQHSDCVWHDRSRIVAWIEDSRMILTNGKIDICKPVTEEEEKCEKQPLPPIVTEMITSKSARTIEKTPATLWQYLRKLFAALLGRQ